MSSPEDRDLGSLLERMRPEPTRKADWEDVVKRSHRSGRAGRVAGRVVGLAAGAAVAGILVVLVLAAPRGKETPASPAASEIMVPDLTGLEIEVARAQAKSTGLEIGVVTARPDAASAASVLSQTPAPGAPLARNRWITVEIASPIGPRKKAPRISAQAFVTSNGKPYAIYRSVLPSPTQSLTTLIFSAGGCQPCRQFDRAAQRLASAFGGFDEQTGFVAVGGRVRDVRLDNAAIIPDPDREVSRALGVTGVPEMLVVDRSGRIAVRVRGLSGRPFPNLESLVTAVRTEPVQLGPGSKRLRFDSALFDLTTLGRNDVPPEFTGPHMCPVDLSDVRRVQLGGAYLYLARGPNSALAWSLRGPKSWSPSCVRYPRPVLIRSPGLLPLISSQKRQVSLVERGYTEAFMRGRWVPVRQDGLLVLNPVTDGFPSKLRGPRGTLVIRPF